MKKNSVVVIGDMGGQIHIFQQVLDSLGVGADYRIPEGMSIIQIGDVARNVMPDSPLDSLGCVQLADNLMRVNGARYTQLLGNHEFGYLPGAKYPDRWYLDPAVGEIIRSWWDERKVVFAANLHVGDSNILVTHAGLTMGYWNRLKAPTTVREAMRALNYYVGRDSSHWSNPGYLVSRIVDESSDIVWAEASRELLTPWLREKDTMPFSQIYGHSGPLNWSEGVFWDKTLADVCSSTEVDYENRLSHTTTGKLPNGTPAVCYSVDWMLGNLPAPQVYGLRSYEDAEVEVEIPAL